jgi:glycogen debranching enzyme
MIQFSSKANQCYLPNRVPATVTPNKDSIGWLWKRIESLIKIDEKSKGKNRILSLQEKKIIINKLEQCILKLLKKSTKNNYAINGNKETWMDTDWGNDGRVGVRIEIQAMRLFIYKLMYNLSKKQIYKDLELRLKERVVSEMWNGMILADGLNDWTIRPNIFIAYYFYPELLSKKEWKVCFDTAIKHLWLEWGGFSTIEIGHTLYQNYHTGEEPISYHRGDSWFWINNLAALCMFDLDKKYFNKQIQKIVKGSTNEILNMGTLGTHTELSSAQELLSQGCLSQAWSLAFYIELFQKMSI